MEKNELDEIREHIEHLLGPCELCDEIRDTVMEHDQYKPLIEAAKIGANAMELYQLASICRKDDGANGQV